MTGGHPGTGKELGKETGEGNKIMGYLSFGHSKQALLVSLYGDFQKLPVPPIEHQARSICILYDRNGLGSEPGSDLFFRLTFYVHN